jgi:pimeloyl-ACP methyl ester carboxylesterase
MRITANGIGIEVQEDGPPNGDPLLLITGFGMQIPDWPDEFVRLLVEAGFRVIRHDNRDLGLGDGFDHLGMPNLIGTILRHMLRFPVAAPYRMSDMAADALGVLDALGIEDAHVCGISMGGTIAQHVAVLAPARCKSLTLMMTTTGARRLPQPKLQISNALMALTRRGSTDEVVERYLRLDRLVASPAFPQDLKQLEQQRRHSVARAWRPAGLSRHLIAIMADGDRSATVTRITSPTRIIHGLDDRLVPVAAAHDLSKRIPGAMTEIVPGLGHNLPLELLPLFAKCITENASRFEKRCNTTQDKNA